MEHFTIVRMCVCGQGGEGGGRVINVGLTRVKQVVQAHVTLAHANDLGIYIPMEITGGCGSCRGGLLLLVCHGLWTGVKCFFRWKGDAGSSGLNSSGSRSLF